MSRAEDELIVAQVVDVGDVNGVDPAPSAHATLAAVDAADAERSTSPLERLGERLNPILVKETRQALKSRQFAVTFVLVLTCAWLWTLFGIALIGPGVRYESAGAQIFYGYYLILAFPLLVIVPFGAFRSLAGEHEDRTYELLSITSLRPRQIINGKLGSAAAQMIVYLSAIAPCLAFTYLLRGIDLPTIFLTLVYTVLASFGLSAVAMLIGTLTHEKHWQVVLSVLVIAGLFVAFFIAMGMSLALLEEPVSFIVEPGFWIANAALLTAYASTLVLVATAASSRLTFASENRSTRLRVVMLAQHVLFVGWIGFTWLYVASGALELLYFATAAVGFYWFTMGSFMTGEEATLSPRVRRRLPKSFLGRMLLTWFNPGPGIGYIFAVANTAAAALIILAAIVLDPHTRYFARTSTPLGATFRELMGFGANYGPGATARMTWTSDATSMLLIFAALVVGYVIIYLGIGRFIVSLLRRYASLPLPAVPLVHFLLVAAGTGIPMTVHLMSPRMRLSSYHLIEASNPFLTLGHFSTEALDTNTFPPDAPVVLVMVSFVAALVLLLSMLAVARDVQQVRGPLPARVLADDAEAAMQKAPAEPPSRTSPWD